MKRSTIAALAVASTALTLLSTAPSASAGGHRGALVTGTFSRGASHTCEPLPTVRVGDDARSADASVVVDP